MKKPKGTVTSFDKIYSFFYKNSLLLKGANISKDVVLCFGCKLRGKKIKIGSHTVIGRNVSISADSINIGKNCLFYPNSILFSNNSFELGYRGKISRNCIFRANNIIIGNDLWCNEEVRIGEGGWNQNTGNITIGNHQFIGPRSTINLSEEVYIGGYGGLGVETSIYTHGAGHGQPMTEGYYAEQSKVVIEKNVSILSRALILPGVKIHYGATIAANSVVTRDVESNKLIGGIPGKAIGSSKKEISDEKRERIILDILTEGLNIEWAINGGSYTTKFNNKTIIFDYDSKIKNEISENSIIITYNNEEENNNFRRNYTVIDLKNLVIKGVASAESEKIRDKLRRKGLILSFDDYTPFLLNYDFFIESYIELI